MEFITVVVFGFIADAILWPIGAAAKKLFRRPISESGRSEISLGLAIVLAVIFVILLSGWWTYQAGG